MSNHLGPEYEPSITGLLVQGHKKDTQFIETVMFAAVLGTPYPKKRAPFVVSSGIRAGHRTPGGNFKIASVWSLVRTRIALDTRVCLYIHICV